MIRACLWNPQNKNTNPYEDTQYSICKGQYYDKQRMKNGFHAQ